MALQLLRNLAVHTKLRLCHPQPQPNQPPDHTEDNHSAHRNTNDVCSDNAPSTSPLIVQERIHIESLRRIRQERQTQVHGQYDDQPQQVYPQRWTRPRDDDLEECEDAVEGMLCDVLPALELGREPRAAVQGRPVNDGDEEGVHNDGAVEERVQGLQGSEEGVEGGAVGASEGVGGGVQGCDEEVECEAPEGEDGEEGEGVASGAATAE